MPKARLRQETQVALLSIRAIQKQDLGYGPGEVELEILLRCNSKR